MEFLWDIFHKIYDVESLVRVGGLVGLTAIVFVETGLLIGFFLPGILFWLPRAFSPRAVILSCSP